MMAKYRFHVAGVIVCVVAGVIAAFRGLDYRFSLLCAAMLVWLIVEVVICYGVAQLCKRAA